MSNDDERTDGAISKRARAAVKIAGGASWLAGCAATFVGDNGPGAAVLVATGAAALLLGLVGRWPQRIAVSGNEVAWAEVRDTVTSAIVASESDPATESATEELRDLLDRLEQLRLTGSAPAHPAELYDLAVEAAVRRLFPHAVLTASGHRDRAMPDYEMRLDGQIILVETKWRQHPERPMGGSTLPQLVEALPPEARLVVVSNATDVSGGQQVLDALMPSPGQIVSWQDARHDNALAAAVHGVLQRGEVAS